MASGSWSKPESERKIAVSQEKAAASLSLQGLGHSRPSYMMCGLQNHPWPHTCSCCYREIPNMLETKGSFSFWKLCSWSYTMASLEETEEEIEDRLNCDTTALWGKGHGRRGDPK